MVLQLKVKEWLLKRVIQKDVKPLEQDITVVIQDLVLKQGIGLVVNGKNIVWLLREPMLYLSMAEKKGLTVKLINDFQESKSLEIYLESLQRWHRVISKEFRSWNGKRRITEWDSENNPHYKEYEGSLFYYMTNNIVKDPTQIGIQYLTSPIPAKLRLSETS